MKRPVAELLASIELYVELQSKQQKLQKHEVAFSRRSIREETGLPNHRIKDLFHELEELEYLEVEKSSRGGSFVYRLTDRKSTNKASGLLTTEQLKKKLENKSGRSGRNTVLPVQTHCNQSLTPNW
jgi:hypothetical protein